MSWFNDYGRDYDRATGYGRGGYGRDRWGMRSGGGSDRGWRGSERQGWGGGQPRDDQRGGYWGESSTRPSYERDYLGRQHGYDAEYDNQFRRRRPEESPFYGRGADQGVQRWARRYGYDMQYEIEPGGRGGRGSSGPGQGGYGAGSSGGGYGGAGRGNDRWGRNRGRFGS